jgi:MFS family permease
MPAMAKAGSFVDAFLKSPFSGIAPWVLMSVLTGPGKFEEAVCAALGLSLLTLWLSWRRGHSVHALDIFGVAFFVILAIVGLVASDGLISFLELWAGEMTNIALALFVVATIAVRKPFTLPYAKETAPEEHWSSPLFLHINYAISWVWGGAFIFSAIVGFIGDAVLHDSGNFWTGWVLQLAAIFFAVEFTEFYPDYAGAKDAVTRGEDEPVPALVKLIDWVPTFVLIAGIFGWVTDALPDAVGIAMIAVGIIGNILIGRFFRT